MHASFQGAGIRKISSPAGARSVVAPCSRSARSSCTRIAWVWRTVGLAGNTSERLMWSCRASWSSERPRRHRASSAHTQQYEGERIGQQQENLIGNVPSRRLEEELKRTRRAEQECRKPYADRMPSAEDDNGDGNEPASSRHAFGKGPGLSQYEGRSAGATE